MAASTLPKPGTEYGPCTDEHCGHRDCALTREQAAARCRYCGKPIGYETRFYSATGGWVHAECLERLETDDDGDWHDLRARMDARNTEPMSDDVPF